MNQPPGRPRLEVAGVTRTGRVRERNEDALLIRLTSWTEGDVWHDAALLVVADGMGGYQAGDQAAQMTIRSVGHALDFLFDGALVGRFRDTPIQQIAETLEFALKDVNRQLHQRSRQNPELRGMGATVVLALIWSDQLLICHVGDTRAYLCRAGKFQQVTKDQTLVARMVELGQLSPQEARTHPNRHEVSQALGKRPNVEPMCYQQTIQAGDWWILTSDGLHADLEETQIASVVVNFRGSARQLADLLAQAAEQAGGSDNITVIVASYA
ncbi:MAG: protein phosphatase 2C domain-containing protein [Gemmatales bacterium]|nr:protein phosphatase 2C domain-containing protein [Gemmatales bacterium]MCS7159866.1 protein phosphatase 2C domain-containing protein [Gemmatales bacterium]MDW8175065.1 protein phosphatase 2C domain-containing protein [Gemmatales bacterium]MDW8223224.1 protein phosphatase 2C domain-containing protein [Gemmatales bacterium]